MGTGGQFFDLALTSQAQPCPPPMEKAEESVLLLF